MNATPLNKIYRAELKATLDRITPNCPGGRYSGQQLAAAKGIARNKTLAVADERARVGGTYGSFADKTD